MVLRTNIFRYKRIVIDIAHLSCGSIHLGLMGLTASRLAGRLADEKQVESKTFKILYGVSYVCTVDMELLAN